MAGRRPKTALYFTRIVVTQDDFCILGGHLYLEGQEPTVTRFIAIDKGKSFFLYDFEQIVYAATKKPAPPGKPRDTLCIMGRWGKYRENVTGEKPVDSEVDAGMTACFQDLRYVGKRLYTCGSHRFARRQEGRRWPRADQGAFNPALKADRAFQSIHGPSEDDLYAVGWEVWHWDGKKWTRERSPTRTVLYSVLATSSGDVYVAGGGGALFKRNGRGGWNDLSDPTVQDDTIWKMSEFQGRVFLAGHDRLLVTDGKQLTEMKVPLKGKKSFMTLDSTANQLWVAGDDNIFQFDGRSWIRHLCLDNVPKK